MNMGVEPKLYGDMDVNGCLSIISMKIAYFHQRPQCSEIQSNAQARLIVIAICSLTQIAIFSCRENRIWNNQFLTNDDLGCSIMHYSRDFKYGYYHLILMFIVTFQVHKVIQYRHYRTLWNQCICTSGYLWFSCNMYFHVLRSYRDQHLARARLFYLRLNLWVDFQKFWYEILWHGQLWWPSPSSSAQIQNKPFI